MIDGIIDLCDAIQIKVEFKELILQIQEWDTL